MGSLFSSRRTLLYLGEGPFLPREASYIFQACAIPTCVFPQHTSLGRSSGEPAGSKKERRQRRLQRRQRTVARVGPAGQELFLFSAIAAPPHRDNESSLVFQNPPVFAFSERVENVCGFRTAGRVSTGNEGFAATENSRPKLIVLNFPSPQDPFLDRPARGLFALRRSRRLSKVL